MGSYFQITIPQEVEIYNPREIESECGIDVTGFYWNSRQIKCDVKDRIIKVSNGFEQDT